MPCAFDAQPIIKVPHRVCKMFVKITHLLKHRRRKQYQITIKRIACQVFIRHIDQIIFDTVFMIPDPSIGQIAVMIAGRPDERGEVKEEGGPER